MKIAFQGEKGAFSEEAVHRLFPEDEPIPCSSFDEVFEKIQDQSVDYGVVPIENSLHGSVHANYDLLLDHSLSIIAEGYLRIEHHLMAISGTELGSLEKVYSHGQALGQCQKFLKEKLPQAERLSNYDTAGSARRVAELGDKKVAAIASERAAQEYGLEILSRNIESHHQNYTRFLALSRQPIGQVQTKPQQQKTSIVFSQKKNVPGSLFKSLAVFALRDLDLFKIESRPLVGSPGQYVFYIDLEGSIEDDPVQKAIEHLKEIAADVRILGSYRAAELPGS